MTAEGDEPLDDDPLLGVPDAVVLGDAAAPAPDVPDAAAAAAAARRRAAARRSAAVVVVAGDAPAVTVFGEDATAFVDAAPIAGSLPIAIWM